MNYLITSGAEEAPLSDVPTPYSSALPVLAEQVFGITEIVQSIFSYLDDASLQSVASVSEFWKGAAICAAKHREFEHLDRFAEFLRKKLVLDKDCQERLDAFLNDRIAINLPNLKAVVVLMRQKREILANILKNISAENLELLPMLSKEANPPQDFDYIFDLPKLYRRIDVCMRANQLLALKLVAEPLAAKGFFSKALEVTHCMPTSIQKDEAYCTISENLVRHDRFINAEEVASCMGDENKKIFGAYLHERVKACMAYLQARKIEEATEVVATMHCEIESMDPMYRRIRYSLASRVTRVLVNRDALKEARGVATSLNHYIYLDDLLLQICEQLYSLMKLDSVSSISTSIQDRKKRILFTYVVEEGQKCLQYIEDGEIEASIKKRALAINYACEPNEYLYSILQNVRHFLLHFITSSLAKADKLGMALEVAEEIKEQSEKDALLFHIAETLALNLQFDYALEIAGIIHDPKWSSFAFYLLIKMKAILALANGGKVEEALNEVSALKYPSKAIPYVPFQLERTKEFLTSHILVKQGEAKIHEVIFPNISRKE